MLPRDVRREEKYLMIAIIVFIVLFVVLAGFFIYRYHSFRRAGLVAQNPWFVSLFYRHSRPLTVADIGLIQSWMTFEYISRAFNVPTSTLAAALSTPDPYFPHITIAAYAGQTHQDQAVMIGEIQSAVREYLTPVAGSTTNR